MKTDFLYLSSQENKHDFFATTCIYNKFNSNIRKIHSHAFKNRRNISVYAHDISLNRCYYLMIIFSFSCGLLLKISLEISHMWSDTKCVTSLLYRKISLSQLPREMKTQSHHTTASHDPVDTCAITQRLQDVFSADAPLH